MFSRLLFEKEPDDVVQYYNEMFVIKLFGTKNEKSNRWKFLSNILILSPYVLCQLFYTEMMQYLTKLSSVYITSHIHSKGRRGKSQLSKGRPRKKRILIKVRNERGITFIMM